MRTQLSKLAFAAGISLALVFTFGCSGDDSSENSKGNGGLSSDSNSGHNHSSNSVAGISSSDGNSNLSSSSNGGNNSGSSSSTGISSSGGGSSSGSRSSSSIGQSSSSGGKSSSSSLGQSSSSSGNSSSSFVNDGKECDAIFNPDNKFCYDGNVYDKCGGNTYNPVTQGCLGSIVGEKCGGNVYSQATQFCYDNIIYYKCGGNTYNPVTHGCLEYEIVEKCGVMVYSQATQFCYDNNVYAKCDGMTYNPATHICQNGVATPAKCGNEGYNPITQYCGNGTLKNYGSVTDARDGKKYKITVIGTQTWMAENLNYDTGSSKCYNNDPANCVKYGGSYNSAMAMAACPSGWHLPSNADWNVLMRFVNPTCSSDYGSCAGAGTKLKASYGWNSYSGIPIGTDNFGFSALPGGIGSYNGISYSFSSVGNSGSWWISDAGNSYVYSRNMGYGNEDVSWNSNSREDLRSVRCLKD